MNAGEKMADSDRGAMRDILWKMYQEHTVQGRHHETQRATVASALVAISSAIIGIVIFDERLSLWDIPLTLMLTAIGAFGVIFSAKHYERFNLHMERARTYRDALDGILPGSPLKSLKEEADKRSETVVTKIRLNWLWYGLNGLVFVLGIVLTVMAALGSPSTQVLRNSSATMPTSRSTLTKTAKEKPNSPSSSIANTRKP
jgi:hypothetical protein